jgi:hypothetical protein
VHSHDRTMLSKLGFADPDKKDPRHDLACLYLTQPEVVGKVAAWLLPRIPKFSLTEDKEDSASQCTAVSGKGVMEYHLQKGEGKYATTVGFLDVVFDMSLTMDCISWHGSGQYVYEKDGRVSRSQYQQVSYVRVERRRIFCEVKVGRVSIGDVLRQMNLYKSYTNGYEWGGGGRDNLGPLGILVAPWDVSLAEKDSLNKAGYAFMRLGKDFDAWVERQEIKTDSACEL